ncbi:hypothetical protein Tco_0267896 [Tanacetum coccineum]
MEELKENSINEAEVLAVVEEEGDTWMTPIYNYLTEETLPTEKDKARAYACRNKICGSQGHTNRVLLANNACGCKKDDKGMSRLPGPGKVKFLIVAIDYFTKWIKAKPVATITGTIHSKIGVKSYASANALPLNGDTPFSLTYGTKAVIPAEIGMPTLRIAEVDMMHNDEALEINLDLLEERREQTAIREARSKAKMEKYYNSKVRNTSFKPG